MNRRRVRLGKGRTFDLRYFAFRWQLGTPRWKRALLEEDPALYFALGRLAVDAFPTRREAHEWARDNRIGADA